MAELPTSTVTFLFTDLERSMLLWEQQDLDVMGQALKRHDVILRWTVESHGGTAVKTTGDGSMLCSGWHPTRRPRPSRRRPPW
jgi:class 3 adenylate cyclase